MNSRWSGISREEPPGSGALIDKLVSPCAINRAALATGAAVFLGSAAVLVGALALGQQRLQASLRNVAQLEQQATLSNSAHTWTDPG